MKALPFCLIALLLAGFLAAEVPAVEAAEVSPQTTVKPAIDFVQDLQEPSSTPSPNPAPQTGWFTSADASLVILGGIVLLLALGLLFVRRR